MKRTIKEVIILICSFSAVIATIVMASKWNNGAFDGTILDKIIPMYLMGLLVGFVVFCIAGLLFRYSPEVWLWSAGIAFVLTVAYMLLELDEEVGLIILCVLIGILLLISLIRWIAQSRK